MSSPSIPFFSVVDYVGDGAASRVIVHGFRPLLDIIVDETAATINYAFLLGINANVVKAAAPIVSESLTSESGGYTTPSGVDVGLIETDSGFQGNDLGHILHSIAFGPAAVNPSVSPGILYANTDYVGDGEPTGSTIINLGFQPLIFFFFSDGGRNNASLCFVSGGISINSGYSTFPIAGASLELITRTGGYVTPAGIDVGKLDTDTTSFSFNVLGQVYHIVAFGRASAPTLTETGPSVRYVTSDYVGDGTSSRLLSIGFPPRLLVIFDETSQDHWDIFPTANGGLVTKIAAPSASATATLSRKGGYTTPNAINIGLLNTEFISKGTLDQVNLAGDVYHLFAFG